jgi:hypothetical protein
MSARAGLIRRGLSEAPEREIAEQTIRRLGAETAEQTSVRLGLKAAKQRRRRLGLKTLGGAVVVAFGFLIHSGEAFGVWNLSRASWYHRGLIAVGGIAVVTIAVSAYRRRSGIS